MRFGRLRPRVVHPHLKLGNYLRAALPAAPASCDYYTSARSIVSDVMLNDQLGDCGIAGGYHIVGVETTGAGDPYHATRADIIADYGAIGGYVDGDPSTDNGIELQTALAYWQTHGFRNGTKLLGYLSVDATNAAEVMAAIWLFGGSLYLGLELPDSYVSPFPSSDGFTWDSGQPDPNNGHCIVGLGYDSAGVKVDTWGMVGTFTWRALAELCSSSAGGEAWIMLTPDQLAKGAAKAPNGVAWHDLVSDWDSIGGVVPVPPTPTPAPPPGPAPAGPPTLWQAQSAVQTALQAGHALMTRQQAIGTALQALTPLWPQ